ncbi:beta-N-acetylglucosaminidase domain-containing protein [Novosphingobium sp. ST904]|uniref:beta-N-acetylglucosaminidase domain-containing protein n=1 Tax=Novosphingobium sp. ST904 TaxID=1684385 RepID=UPI0006C8C494|nr:beta-N-acetylglucosaminidase domain-containing protein [Novosphingobium sp. ST904]KPH58175.1 hyaluronidase [Novosphingobium sp. ST904]TCM41317.1 beta-N-acetylglucosaminidase [Novosphingobium sp. ST904]
MTREAPAAKPVLQPELGLIEGRFGRIWNEAERSYVVRTLAEAGYGFYHYGPKADRSLRREWRKTHDAAQAESLARLSAECRAAGMRFGMAITPVGSTHPFDDAARADLTRRVAELDAIGIDDLAVLFDDLRGDMPELAERQAEVVNFCAGLTRATRVYTCPTYYSDDPVLDLVFADRPADYLGKLGRLLDPAVQVYWTGEEVCAKEIGPAHLERVAGELGRKVCLWDNWPVNDGARMSRFLHLRAFTGRPAGIAEHVSGHAINPAIQAHLGCIPALTLPMVYAQGGDYAYGAAFAAAARRLLGDEFAVMLQQDLPALQDVGYERLGVRGGRLRARYEGIDHPAAREILHWLDGADLMTDDEVQTQ